MQDNDEKWLWFAAGAVLGASAALLLTPAGGAEVRQQAGSHASQTALQLLDRGREWYDRGRQFADEAAQTFGEGQRLTEEGLRMAGGMA